MARATADIQLIIPDWAAPPSVGAASTTRIGGVGQGPFSNLNLADHVGDDPDSVQQNRRRLVARLGLSENPCWLKQVHGIEIVPAEQVHRPVSADGSITTQVGVVCAVLTADCLPVLFCDRDGTHIAAVHGGWRGLAAGVLEAAVDAFRARGIQPANLLAWLGPAIGPAAYEVGTEVFEALGQDRDRQALSNNAGSRWQLDLYALARARLHSQKVDRIYGGGDCTMADAKRFFSYRRDGVCGRQATLIWRRS
jgi:YfiH family protein